MITIGSKRRSSLCKSVSASAEPVQTPIMYSPERMRSSTTGERWAWKSNSNSGMAARTRAKSPEPQLARIASETPRMSLPLRRALSSRNTLRISEMSGVTFSTNRVPWWVSATRRP